MDPLGRLHILTDTVVVAEAALAAGAPVVQVRLADHRTDREAYQVAYQICGLARARGAICLINDRLDVALAVGADGAHVGADDLPVAAARRVLGPAAILGVSCRDPGAARAAFAAGATYLGVGPAYASDSKPGLPAPIGPAGVAAVAGAVPAVPVIAIGGVTADRVGPLLTAGAYGVAVIGAVGGAGDPAAATRGLLDALEVAG